MWEFGGVDQRDVPLEYLGLRGISYVELSVETASRDVHSGLGGSIFPNAAWRLVWALNTLKGEDERILIPGFYDAVRPPSKRDHELMSALPDQADEYRSMYGVQKFIKGLQGGEEFEYRRGVFTNLYHLWLDLRLSRSRLENGPARPRLCQNGFPACARSASG